jgi:hypothetical protein
MQRTTRRVIPKTLRVWRFPHFVKPFPARRSRNSAPKILQCLCPLANGLAALPDASGAANAKAGRPHTGGADPMMADLQAIHQRVSLLAS